MLKSQCEDSVPLRYIPQQMAELSSEISRLSMLVCVLSDRLAPVSGYIMGIDKKSAKRDELPVPLAEEILTQRERIAYLCDTVSLAIDTLGV